MIVAFDFDKCLSEPIMQRLAIKMRRSGNELWVVTMRSDNDFNRNTLQPVLDKMYLTQYNVIYCGGKQKWEMLQMINADIYIDNISDEFETILNHTKTVPLLWCNQ